SPPDRLSDDDVRRVLDIPEPQAFVVRLALSTGMRWGEMCRASAKDLDGNMLIVHRTKSGKVRRVPLHPEILRELKGRVGRLVPYSERANGSFNKFVARNSGIRKFHVHQLRHTFACRWLERGGSLPALQQILGHASVVTTQHYAKLGDDLVRREAARITGSDPYGWRPPTTD
ncbi:MAG: site-specific integrase, partial [Candidatus Eisenbacteria bacterium]|nr:site-specific integrase [Candidatus Eisenbacteria bacterium]